MVPDPSLVTAQQEAYFHLRDRILSGELTGDTKLNPAEIARSLGISRMPVREALRQLDAEGFVIMRPNRAATVTRLSATEVEELFEIRAALEVMALRYAMPNLTEDALAELTALKDRMDRARNNAFEWVARHDDFHQAICELGRRKRIAQEVSRVRLAIRPYLLMYLRVFEIFEIPGIEHNALLDAIGSRDVTRAERSMLEHVSSPRTGILDFLRKRDAEADKNGVVQSAKADAQAQRDAALVQQAKA